MSCLTLRTKSPPDISSSAMMLVELLASGPAVGQGEEAGVGRPGQREPGLLLGPVELGAQLLDHHPPLAQLGGGKRRRRRRRRAPRLVAEGGGRAGQRRRVELVEDAGAQRLGHQQVGLVVQPGQLAAGLGERPAVDVAPRLEHPQHPVELAGQRLRASADALLDALGVAVEAVGPVGGPQVAVQLGAGGHGEGSGLGGRRHAGLAPPALAPVGPSTPTTPSSRSRALISRSTTVR